MHGAVYVLYVTTTLIIAVVCMAVSLTNSKRCLETSNTDTKRRYANINEALTAANAVQRNHMSVIQNGYAALQKALRK